MLKSPTYTYSRVGFHLAPPSWRPQMLRTPALLLLLLLMMLFIGLLEVAVHTLPHLDESDFLRANGPSAVRSMVRRDGARTPSYAWKNQFVHARQDALRLVPRASTWGTPMASTWGTPMAGTGGTPMAGTGGTSWATTIGTPMTTAVGTPMTTSRVTSWATSWASTWGTSWVTTLGTPMTTAMGTPTTTSGTTLWTSTWGTPMVGTEGTSWATTMGTPTTTAVGTPMTTSGVTSWETSWATTWGTPTTNTWVTPMTTTTTTTTTTISPATSPVTSPTTSPVTTTTSNGPQTTSSIPLTSPSPITTDVVVVTTQYIVTTNYDGLSTVVQTVTVDHQVPTTIVEITTAKTQVESTIIDTVTADIQGGSNIVETVTIDSYRTATLFETATITENMDPATSTVFEVKTLTTYIDSAHNHGGAPQVVTVTIDNHRLSTEVVTVTSNYHITSTAVETLKLTAIANSQMPWYNPAITPAIAKVDSGTVYEFSVVWPAWASFVGSGALAVIGLVLLQLLLSAVCAAVILVEPFARLASADGAKAAESFFISYTKQNLLTDPFKFFMYRSWLPLLASLASLVSIFFAPLASEVIMTNTHSCTKSPPGWDSSGKNPCPPQLMVNMQVLRSLQILLGVVAAVTILMTYLVHRRKTHGVSGDPSSIIMVASLLHDAGVMNDLRRIPPEASPQQAKKVLRQRQYCLSTYESTNGRLRYGLMRNRKKEETRQYRERQDREPPRRHTSRLKYVRNLCLGIALLSIFGIVVAYGRISAPNNSFNEFFNRQSFGARFVLTMSGNLVATLWHDIYTDVNLKAVFKDLFAGGARAQYTILAKYWSFSLRSLIPSLRRRHYMAFWASIVDVLAILMIIALPGVPFKSSEVRDEYLICSYFVLVISGVMFLFLLVYMWWAFLSRNLPEVNDLEAILRYVVDSDLLRILNDNDFGSRDSETITKIVKRRTWSMRKLVGPDQVERWTITADAESLMA